MPYFDLWTHRIKITLPAAKVDSDVLNPVVPVKLDSTALASLHDILGSGLTNRKKCAFANTTDSYYYAEIKDWTTGCFFVATDTLSSVTGHIFYLYFSAAASDSVYMGDAGDAAAQNAWTTGTINVYNFEQSPFGTDAVLDSKSSRNGNAQGGMGSIDLVSAQFGNGLNFDGIDDYIDLGTDAIGITSVFTFNILANFTSQDGAVLAKHASGNYGFALRWDVTQKIEFGVSSNGSAWNQTFTDAGDVPEDEYHLISIVYNGSDVSIFIDGAINSYQSPDTYNQGFNDSNQSFRIASSEFVDLRKKGIFNHVSIHSVARSASWLSVLSEGLFGTLLTFAAVETADTIRELILVNLVSNLENITTANGYNTDAGNSVVRSDEIGELTGLPGIAIDIKQDEPADEQIYGYDVLNMPITISVADTYTFGGTIAANKLAVSQKGEQILGDIRKAMAQTVTLAKSVVYVNGGIEDYPLQRENEFSVLVKADFNINYETLKNDPYNQ